MWYYWDTWLNESIGFVPNDLSGAGKAQWYELIDAPNGMSVEMTHSRGYDRQKAIEYLGSKNVEKEFQKYKELAEENEYNVTIYHFADYSNDGKEYQHFVLIERFPPTEKRLDIPVKKNWHDNNNKYNTRVESIQVELYKNGVATGEKLVLNDSNNWTDCFKDLPELDDDGNAITYEVKEISPEKENYVTIEPEANSNEEYIITNKLLTQVTVKKEWDDMDNLDEIRPNSVTVTLYSNGVSTGKMALLSEENGWTVTFDGLYLCDSSGNVITYSVVEDSIAGYKTEYSAPKEDENTGYTTITVTNTHTPNYAGYIEITGKVWEDIPDGKANQINGIIDEDEKGLGGIKVTLKDKNGNQFDATSTAITAEDGTYTIKVNYDDSQDVYKLYGDDSIPNKKTEKQITETKLKTSYIEFEYDGYVYTTVANGGIGDVNKSKGKEEWDSRKVLDEKYSTITTASPKVSEIPKEDKMVIASTKDVITNFITYRDKTVNKVSVNVETRTETQTVKYCNGDGTCIRTNPNGAWNEIIQGEHVCENSKGTGHSLRTYNGIEVKTIKNVNLGLYKRELPDLSINEDIEQVEVIYNGKKETFKYTTVVVDENEEDVKVQFANKQTYTYRRPVSADYIEELQEIYDPTKSKTEILQVYITYAVKITNESATLKAKVNSLINCFDNRYVLESAKINTTNINTSKIEKYTDQLTNSIYKQSAADYTEIKLKDLNLSINAGKTSSTIFLKYKVSPETILDLLNGEATLSNSIEIESYTTYYSTKTRYAQYNKDGRNGKVYAGYDIDSQPGNAGIKLETVDYTYTFKDDNGSKHIKTYEDVAVLKSTENLVDYKLPDGTIVKMPQDDTDIAPSFLLYTGESLEEISQTVTLGGFVFEDTNIKDNEERLGNGKYDDEENKVANVKVELYQILKDGDGNITSKLAEHYKGGSLEPAIVYTNSDGYYSFEVNSKENKDYFMKFTYGDDTAEFEEENPFTTIDGITKVNARNYKSTIITHNKIKEIIGQNYTDEGFDKMWYTTENLGGYSIAVDNMLDRLEIKELKADNFYKNEDGTTYVQPENMTAYSKPFLIPANSGLSNIGIFNFGIIERPRENIVVQKTVTNLNVVLSNGQSLTSGDPRTQKLQYVKAIGFGGQQGNYKQLAIEMDPELIQASQLQANYEISVTNYSEIDYDYGNENDYKDEIVHGEAAVGQYDKFITKNENAKYYYYGDKTERAELLLPTIRFVDYLDSEVSYVEDLNNQWFLINFENLETENLLTLDTKTIKRDRYKIFSISDDMRITLDRGVENTVTKTMLVTKTLTNNQENVFDNNIEILTIDGKTARTIRGTDNGQQIEKEYMPGNLLPLEGGNEQDDDIVKITITPPTGIVTYIIYIVTAVAGLVIIVFGITFIKRKIIK